MHRSLLPVFALFVMFFLLDPAARAQNAYLTNAFMPRFCMGSTDHPIVVRVRNSAATPLISFKVEWRWNNGPVQDGPWQSTTGISGNQYWEYPHPIPFNQPGQSPGLLKVWVTGIGDTDASNDTLLFPITPLSTWTAKTQLLEMWTATWCQYCPPANLVGNNENGDPLVVVAKHHANDAYSNGSSTTYFNQYNVTFTPGGVIEQGEFGTYEPNGNHGFWAAELDQRSIGVSPVIVEVSTVYNSTSRELSATLDATFTEALAGTYTVNMFVVEDNIPGDQTNAPANYVHHQVVRHVMEGVAGINGIIPATPVPGTIYSHTRSHILGVDLVPQNVRVIGVVTQRVGGTTYTMNAVSSDALVVGVGEHDEALSGLRVYPNPGLEALWVEVFADPAPVTLQLFSSDGRLLLEQRSVAGDAPIELNGYGTLSPGSYQLRLERSGQRSERQVVKLN